MSEKKVDNKINVEELTGIYNKIKGVLNTELTEEMLKNNVIEFEFNTVEYRISQPTFKQKQEAYKYQVEKHLELLQDSKYMLEDDLKKLYLEKKGVDIDKIISKINILEKERNNLQFKLGEALKDKASKVDMDSYKKEILNIEKEQEMLSIKKTKLLEFSIENQTLVFGYSYLTYLITQKKSEDKWIKAWDNYDDFLNTDDSVINYVSWYTGIILRNQILNI